MAIIQISKIQVRTGNLDDLPQLALGELGWAADEKRLFIGNDPNVIGAQPDNTEILTQYYPGTSGYSGFNGASGYSGATGPSGGASGVSGYSGLSGWSGASGISGYSGSIGTSGYSGTSGAYGISGTSGFSGNNSIPFGIIMLWYGSTASIPSGWVLCDGTNSTPNLTNKFIVGAGGTYSVAATGGSTDAFVVSHTHTTTITDPGHQHYVGSRDSTAGDGGGYTQEFVSNYTNTANGPSTYTNPMSTGITASTASAGSTGANGNLPPYYALCYIMKI
jgi:hypothetical protein